MFLHSPEWQMFSISKRRKGYMKNGKKKKISGVITIRLFIAVFIAFIVSCTVTYVLLHYQSSKNAKEQLKYANTCMALDLTTTAGGYMFEDSVRLLSVYENEGIEAAAQSLEGGNYTYFAKRDGTIFLSGNKEFIGKNVRDIEYVGATLDGLYDRGIPTDGTALYNMIPKMVKTLDGKLDVYYVVMVSILEPDTVLLAAYSQESYDYYTEFAGQVVAVNRTVGMGGYSAIINSEKKVIGTSDTQYNGTEFEKKELIDLYNEGKDGGTLEEGLPINYSGELMDTGLKMMIGRDVFFGEDSYYCLSRINGVYLLSLYEYSRVVSEVNDTIILIGVIEVIIFAVLFIALQLLIKLRITRKINAVNVSLAKITEGDLDEHVEVRDTREFDALSTDINTTVDKLKEYIAEAAARIDADLAVAKAIQSSALPNVFPPFPERKEFELFAVMNAAKEVGGDFYDFYMLNDHTLGFLIADVSGKSIPGAMFMMTSKTIIKSLAESGIGPAEVFTIANEKLCEGNEAEMFVTAWLGYIDLSTGLVRVANAGHNPVVLIRDGQAEYLALKPGLMLAGMEGIHYKEQTLQLKKGDILYLYTDGITEAMDRSEEQYGEDRLQKLLSFGNKYPVATDENGIAGAVCDIVTKDVAKFTDGAEQSDDITMLCLRYLG